MFLILFIANGNVDDSCLVDAKKEKENMVVVHFVKKSNLKKSNEIGLRSVLSVQL